MVADASRRRRGRIRKSRFFRFALIFDFAEDAGMELVTGATGYVGGRLVERLLAEGRAVRALARDPSRLAPRERFEAVRGDVLAGTGVRAALEGCSVAYYLVHSMEAVEAGSGHDFAARDRRAAERFAAAATAAGVERVVYLGGLAPRIGEPSPHIASRIEVERILLSLAPGATALRASILIGARSASFRMLVRLVERLRLLPLPGWRDNVTQPIAERDAIEFLARTPGTPTAARSLDIAGPDVVSYGEMVTQIAEQMGVGRTPIGLGVSLTPPASAIVSAITGQPLELVRPLMESLEHDLLPRDADEAPRLYGIRPLPFERSVERALADWESYEELAAR
jgi:uncharacterized protein YbjT (DUF2867 family)